MRITTSAGLKARNGVIAAALGVAVFLFALTASRNADADGESVSGNDPAVRADMDRLLDVATDFCKQHMKPDGFVPFGLALGNDGKIRFYMFAPNGLMAPTDSVQVIAFGKQSLRAQANSGDLRAVALVYDGRIRNIDGRLSYPDAVIVEIDHREAPSAVSYGFPYHLAHGSGGRKFRYVDDISVNSMDRFAFPRTTSRR